MSRAYHECNFISSLIRPVGTKNLLTYFGPFSFTRCLRNVYAKQTQLIVFNKKAECNILTQLFIFLHVQHDMFVQYSIKNKHSSFDTIHVYTSIQYTCTPWYNTCVHFFLIQYTCMLLLIQYMCTHRYNTCVCLFWHNACVCFFWHNNVYTSFDIIYVSFYTLHAYNSFDTIHVYIINHIYN